MLKGIVEKSSVGPCTEFKRQEQGFPSVFRIRPSDSKFKRCRNSRIVQGDQGNVTADFKNDLQTADESKFKLDLGDDIQSSLIQDTDSTNQNTERFFLSGELCQTDQTVQETQSLQEILDYTRSSSLQIQKRAWGVLLKIFRKLEQDLDERVLTLVEKVNIGLYLRVGLDQKKGFSDVLEILRILMNTRQDRVLGDIVFSRNNLLVLAKSEKLLEGYINAVEGKIMSQVLDVEKEVEKDSFGSIKALLKQDPNMGLLKGNIIERLGYLLTLELEICDLEMILEIILGFSKYSRDSANQILKKGLLETLVTISRKSNFKDVVFLIFFNVCVASKENAQEFVVKNGLDIIMVSIADLEVNPETYLAWMILSVCSKYGLTRGILSDYRPLMYAKAREYFKFSNHECHLKSRIGFLKTLKDFVFLMPKGFTMGSLEDEMKPFLDILLSTFSWIIDLEKVQENVLHLHLASISSALDFFTAYIARLDSTVSTADLCSKIYENLYNLYPIFKKKAQELALTVISYADETPVKSWKFQKMHTDLSDMINNLTNQTFGMDFYSSIADLILVINPWIEDSLNLENDIQLIVDYILEQPQHYWTRFYAQGQLSVLNSYLKSLDKGLKNENEKIKIYFHILSRIQPGQETIGSRTLFSLFKLLGHSSLNSISEILEEYKMIMLDIYDKSFYSDSSLKNSSAIYSCNYESISSLWMEIEENGPTLPLSKSWIYSPIDSFLEEEQNHVTVCSEDLSGYIFIIYSIVSLHDSCGLGLDIGRLMIATMKLCLLSSASDEAICLEPKIQSCLEYVLNEWNSAPICNLETLMGSQVNFYQLYSQLLSNFSSSSFGNELWGRLLLIPLHNMYPCDYKSLFFSSLEPKILGLIKAPLMHNSEDYIISKQDHEKLKIYDRLIKSRRITSERNPFLYYIITANHSLDVSV